MSKATGEMLQEIPLGAWLALGGVVLGGGVLWFLWHEGKKAAGAVADAAASTAHAINPLNHDNVVQQLGTAIYQGISPDAKEKGLDLSTKIVDWLTPDYDPNA